MTDTPEPLNGSTRWMLKASCASHDRDLWFPGPQHINALRAVQARAKAICQTCPVIDDCLAYALTNDIKHGTWGGLTVKERSKIRGCYPKPSLFSTEKGPISTGCASCGPPKPASSVERESQGDAQTSPGMEQPLRGRSHS